MTNDCTSGPQGPGFYADYYSFTATAGQQVAVGMQSTAFDAYLYLVDDNNTIIAANDDSGVGGVNSRIPSPGGFVTLNSAGQFHIVATSARSNRTGPYELTLALGSTTTPTCTYSLDMTVANNVPATGGNGSVNVTTQSGCTWTATPGANNPSAFLAVTAPTGTVTGSGQMSWTAASNAGAARTGTITVAGQTFTVNQLAASANNCTYTLTNNLITNPPAQASGIGTLDLITNPATNCPWTAISSAPAWLNVNPTSGTTGSGIGADVNVNTGPQRTAMITFTGAGQTPQVFTITQQAGCSYQLNPTGATGVSALGGAGLTFNVVTAAGCTWEASSTDPTRLTVTGGTPGTGPGTVTYSAAFNSGAQRTTNIQVVGTAPNGTPGVAVFPVTQNDGSMLGNCAPQPIMFDVTVFGGLATGDCLSGKAGSEHYTDRYFFSGLAGQMVAVSAQSTAFDGSLFLADNNNVTVAANDDSGVGGVNPRIPAPSGFVTLPTTGTYFIEVTSTTVQSYRVGPYTLTLVSGGGGAVCTYTLDTTVANNVAAAGGNGVVNVTTQTGCTWTATANANNPNSFLTVTAPTGTVTGNGQLTWTAAANTGAARTGTITVAGQTFTVNQVAANACVMTAVTAMLNANPVANTAGSIGTVNPTDTNNCGWTATSSDPSWLTPSLFSGTGGALITVFVTANTGAQRTATLTVAGQVFTVTQAAGVGGCAGMAITTGTSINGALATSDCTNGFRGSSNYTDVYTFNGTIGQVVTVTLTSGAFDAFVYLFDPSNNIVAADDDSGGGRNSRFQVTLGANGEFKIQATSYFPGQTGSYTLSLLSP